MRVSLIIPVYNEEEHLEKFLAHIDSIDLGCEKELVFVNDCSRDKSGEILDKYTFKSKALVLHHTQNQGKGAALRSGFRKASGDIVGVQDADFEYDPKEIPKLITPLLAGQADVVYGSRFKKSTTQVHRTFHYMGNRFLTFLSNVMSGLYLTDMETCYKFFRRNIIHNMNLMTMRFGFEPEVTAKIATLHLRILEFPINYYPRSYHEGKKITWRDGVAAIWFIIYFNLLANKKKFFNKEMAPAKGLWSPDQNSWQASPSDDIHPSS